MSETGRPNFDHPEYSLQKKLGEGGMATVYLANQVKLNRPVALKLMSARISQNESFKRRFMREAQTLARFRHPNIITIYEVETFEDRWFIVMEYLEGGDLKSRIQSGLDQEEALAITKQVASALQYAHGQNYVHRDIKPENCLFDNDDRLVLTDFGIARSMDTGDEQLTQAGVSVGTPAYMAPEQFETSDVDYRADLYSLGVMLYQMLAGERPFAAQSMAAMLFKHATEAVPLLPPQNEALQPLVNVLMAKQPTDRPDSANAVIDAIDHFLNHQSLPAEMIARADQQQTANMPMHTPPPDLSDNDATLIRDFEADDDGTLIRDFTENDEGTEAIPRTSSTDSSSTDRSNAGFSLSRPLIVASIVALVLAGAGIIWWTTTSESAQTATSSAPSKTSPPSSSSPTPSIPPESVVAQNDSAASTDPMPAPTTDPVARRNPNEWFIGRASQGEILVEISTADLPEDSFAMLQNYEESDATAANKSTGWAFFRDQVIADTTLTTRASDKADGWQQVEQYNTIISTGGDDSMNYYYRGFGYQMAEQYDLAIADYQESLSQEPANEFVQAFIDQSRQLKAEQDLLAASIEP
ncbi:MAG: protein kinase [Pseudomonadota bacterium]